MTKLAEVQGLVLAGQGDPWPYATPFSLCPSPGSLSEGNAECGPQARLLVANSGKTLQVSMVGGCTMEPPCRDFQVTRIADLKRSRWCVRGF